MPIARLYFRLNVISSGCELFRSIRICCNQMSSFHIHDRVDYHTDGLAVEDLPSLNPMEFFFKWFADAKSTKAIEEPNAMSLATATKSGLPSLRTVLLKKFDEGGFYFFTNYESRKGREIAENPHAALCFYWEPLKRQVRVEGTVEKIDSSESSAYFSHRPRATQLGALASQQSSVIPSREYLERKIKELNESYSTEVIPRPEHWGGYRLVPDRMEFWQGRRDRVHDRIQFCRSALQPEPVSNVVTKSEDGWLVERLAP